MVVGPQGREGRELKTDNKQPFFFILVYLFTKAHRTEITCTPIPQKWVNVGPQGREGREDLRA